MKLPALKPKEVIKMLHKARYGEIRQTGSHRIFSKNGKEQHVAVPYHNKDLKMGTLRGIIRQTGMSPQQFLKFR